jgi:hypothetical protein
LREVIPPPTLPPGPSDSAESHGDASARDASACDDSACDDSASGDSPHIGDRPGDELWCISTRHLCDVCKCDICGECCICRDPNPPLRVWRIDRCSGAQHASSLDEFLAGDDPDAITCFYVHGARVTVASALNQLPLVYAALTCGLPPEQRVRMVLFSWPNPKSAHILHDFRVAEIGIEPHGRYFGRLLARIDPRVKLSVISFSLGAQIVTGGLHELARSGLQGGRPLRLVRTVFWTAAVDNQFILPGGRHELALKAVDGMLLINNHCDPIVKRFRLITRCYRPEALGYTGLVGAALLGADNSLIRQLDATRSLGVSHGHQRHLDAPDVVGATRQYALWHDLNRPCRTGF